MKSSHTPISTPTTDRLKDSISHKLAAVANEAVDRFLHDIPALHLWKIVKDGGDDRVQKILQSKFPWITPVDVAVACRRMNQMSAMESVQPDQLLTFIENDFRFLESSFEAIAHLSMEPVSRNLFVRVLQDLDPATLNELEKYLKWRGEQPQDEVWREKCVAFGFNVLENANSNGDSWKAFFLDCLLHRYLAKGSLSHSEAIQSLVLLSDRTA